MWYLKWPQLGLLSGVVSSALGFLAWKRYLQDYQDQTAALQRDTARHQRDKAALEVKQLERVVTGSSVMPPLEAPPGSSQPQPAKGHGELVKKATNKE